MYSLCNIGQMPEQITSWSGVKKNWYPGFGGLFCVLVLFSNEFKKEKLKVWIVSFADD